MIFKTVNDLPSISDLCHEHNLLAKKSLGQNFLFDLNITRRIIRQAFEHGSIDFAHDTIIEIGCGPGGLTRSILEFGAENLIVLERDERFVNLINETLKNFKSNLTVINGDALETAVHSLGSFPRHLIANLPYNIATVLLINWLKDLNDFKSMTLMFQKEVALRICAQVGDDAYGRLAVMSNWLCETKILFEVNCKAFIPPPKVTSCVVFLKPREEIFNVSFGVMEKVVRTAFGQRRKMLRSSLSSLENAERLLERAGIDSSLRAEQVEVGGFCRLAKLFEEQGV